MCASFEPLTWTRNLTMVRPFHLLLNFTRRVFAGWSQLFCEIRRVIPLLVTINFEVLCPGVANLCLCSETTVHTFRFCCSVQEARMIHDIRANVLQHPAAMQQKRGQEKAEQQYRFGSGGTTYTGFGVVDIAFLLFGCINQRWRDREFVRVPMCSYSCL